MTAAQNMFEHYKHRAGHASEVFEGQCKVILGPWYLKWRGQTIRLSLSDIPQDSPFDYAASNSGHGLMQKCLLHWTFSTGVFYRSGVRCYPHRYQSPLRPPPHP